MIGLGETDDQDRSDRPRIRRVLTGGITQFPSIHISRDLRFDRWL